MKKICSKNLYAILFCLLSISVFSQADTTHTSLFNETVVKPRMRIIIDNDFGGDPDGLYQLVHHLLSPSVEIRAIIGSHLKPGDDFDPSNITATHAKEKAMEVLSIMHIKNIPVYEGSNKQLENDSTAQPSDAANVIIKEAMRDDTKQPLYVVCGAGLTDIASAYLLKPEIASRLTLIWIGGPEYTDIALPPPGYTSLEYNLGIDIKAGQVVFNKSKMPIWQIPRSSYRQMIIPYSSLILKVKSQGKIGAYLVNALERVMQMGIKYNFNIGEVYIIGDSPLVLLTALQSTFEPDPSSSQYVLRPSPIINKEGLYEVNASGRNIRVYNLLDAHLVYEDFFSKLQMFTQSK